ncbi:MAG: potassium channel beta subunit family protein [Candidatus Limnocylindrales bacterium]|jgi:voltage-dependent potassium channel beta subunit
MEYRQLGSAGLTVSSLSYGAWVTYGTQLGVPEAVACMQAAWDAGVNFFDNAEAYGGGRAEEIAGEALRQLGWRRGSYVVSTKIFFGIHAGPNEQDTLNRKKLREGIDGALRRYGLEYIDLVYCHRPDSGTPVEETVWSMHQMVQSGKALYWGTSEWSAEEIREAWGIAERHHLYKPQMEQPEYNLFTRRKVEQEFARLYPGIGLGLTTFSPLASGFLSGKYAGGIPSDSRLALPGYEWLHAGITRERVEAVQRLAAIATDLGATTAQLALAWLLKNPNVSSVITGASRPSQVRENMQAIDVVPKLTPDVMTAIDEATRAASDLDGPRLEL